MMQVLQTEKRADMQVSLQAITRIEERLAFDFLLNPTNKEKLKELLLKKLDIWLKN